MKKEQAPVTEEAVEETRIDEYALSSFRAMGFSEGLLPDNIVNIYKRFKFLKDRVNPGRLTSEGLAMVVTMADIVDGRIDLAKPTVEE